MVGGMDRYFQIVKCFRDEDLRRPSTRIYPNRLQCENGIRRTRRCSEIFEGMTAHLLKDITGKEFGKFQE